MTPSHIKYDRLRINILYCSNNILPILQVSNYPVILAEFYYFTLLNIAETCGQL